MPKQSLVDIVMDDAPPVETPRAKPTEATDVEMKDAEDSKDISPTILRPSNGNSEKSFEKKQKRIHSAKESSHPSSHLEHASTREVSQEVKRENLSASKHEDKPAIATNLDTNPSNGTNGSTTSKSRKPDFHVPLPPVTISKTKSESSPHPNSITTSAISVSQPGHLTPGAPVGPSLDHASSAPPALPPVNTLATNSPSAVHPNSLSAGISQSPAPTTSVPLLSPSITQLSSSSNVLSPTAPKKKLSLSDYTNRNKKKQLEATQAAVGNRSPLVSVANAEGDEGGKGDEKEKDKTQRVGNGKIEKDGIVKHSTGSIPKG